MIFKNLKQYFVTRRGGSAVHTVQDDAERLTNGNGYNQTLTQDHVIHAGQQDVTNEGTSEIVSNNGSKRLTSVADYLEHAKQFEQDGNLTEAVDYYRQALEMRISARFDNETIVEQEDDTTEIGNGKADQRVQSDFLDPAQILLEQAETHYKNRQWQQTIDLCAKALALNSTSAPAHKLYGNGLQAMGQLDAANEHYQEAVNLNPDYAEAHANLGSIHAQHQQWEQAIACYQQAIAINPDFAGAYRNLAKIWAKTGKHRLALECNYRALTLVDPNTVDGTEWARFGHRLLEEHYFKQAITCYENSLEQLPDSIEVHYNLAEALTHQSRWEDASIHYRQASHLSGSTTIAAHDSAEHDLVYLAVDHDSSSILLKKSVQQAIAHAHNKDWDDVISLCHRVLQSSEPQLTLLYKTLGAALNAQNNGQEAIQWYLKASIIEPESAEIQANLGGLYAQKKQWDNAIECYQKAIAIRPEFSGVHRNLARVYEQTDDKEKAALAWYRALSLEPERATATEHFTLGNILAQHKKLDWAIDCYQRAIQIDDSLSEAHHNLAALLNQAGNYQGAITHYRKTIQLKPESRDSYYALGQVLIQEQAWQKAIACYRQLVQLEPQSIRGYENLKELFIKQNQRAEAIPCYEKLAELQPASSTAQHELGDALNQSENWSDAVIAFQKAISLNPTFSWSHNNLGNALLKLEKWPEAVEAFQKAIALNPEFAWSHFNLGEAYTNLEDWDKAIAAYREALNQDSTLPYVHQKLGDCLHQRKMVDHHAALQSYQQAIDQSPDSELLYHKALELDPNDRELYLKLGQVLSRKNRFDEAIALCHVALQIHPNDIDISTLIENLQIQKDSFYRTFDNASTSSFLYQLWIEENSPKLADFQRMIDKTEHLSYQPTISIILPVYNTLEPMLNEAIQSVINQIYPYWELCIADDASPAPHIRPLLENFAHKDDRIKVIFREENGHISACSNSALTLATGEYIALLDHDDVLTPDALFEVAVLLNQHPEADMIYSDEDKLTEQGDRAYPFFKPDWCPDSFLTRMYTCHFGVYRRSLIEKIDGFRLGYEGSQDYDLVLRVTEQTKKIFHIPKILYHWRIHSDSAASGTAAKPYAYEAGIRALTDALERRGEPGKVVMNRDVPGLYTIRYDIEAYQLISIIIPTRNLGNVLEKCLHSIFDKSTYPNFEVIVVDNGSDEPDTFSVFERWTLKEPDRFRVFKLDIPFNFSRLNNTAVENAKGDYLLFLNNDTEVITADWLEGMVEQVQRSSIGAVGAVLLYPDETIQHAGVVVGVVGVAGHSHKGFPANSSGYFSQMQLTSNYSAVTGACLMCRRDVFDQVGGFDDDLAIAYNDVDLCLKMGQMGYRNLVLPHVRLYHHESKSRGYEDTPEKIRRLEGEISIMNQRWKTIIENDPCYSPNLTRNREDYSYRCNISTKLEIININLPEREPGVIHDFSLDEPYLGQVTFFHEALLRGWVLGYEEPVQRLDVYYENQVVHSISVDGSRPDVASVYPHFPWALHCGFTLHIGELKIPHESELHFLAVVNKQISVPLASIQCLRTPDIK